LATAESLDEQGINTKIIFDGKLHHDSERASVMQSANRQKACIKAIEGRMTLMKLPEGGIATDIEAELVIDTIPCLLSLY
jgi:hypothetical protein